MLLHIHQVKADTLNLQQNIVEEFVLKNEKQIGCFGHLNLHFFSFTVHKSGEDYKMGIGKW